MSPETLLMGLLWYVVFLLAITCHEGAHAWVAKLGGDPTALHGGQLTLNPLPHIVREPFGTVLVPIFSIAVSGWPIGWASAPYDPFWAERYPRRAGLMALAGPAANLVLAAIAAVAVRGGLLLGPFVPPERIEVTHVVVAAEPGVWAGLATLVSMLFVLNLLLFLFNLLPVPPLDGASAVTLLMSEETGRRFRDFTQSWGMIGLLLAWFLFGRIFSPLFVLALNGLYFGIASYG
ncbi:MAG: site-2 protease family protein [Acidobacteria bacterium]|nr:site-2 protease family protein [Acidobacteriota bacterium]